MIFQLSFKIFSKFFQINDFSLKTLLKLEVFFENITKQTSCLVIIFKTVFIFFKKKNSISQGIKSDFSTFF